MMLLQICSVDGWIQGDWMNCIFGPIVGQISTGLFALLVVGAVVGAMYMADGGIAAPSVALVLIGGFGVPLLPGGYQGVAWTIMFLGMVGAILSLAQAWVFE